MKVVLIITLLLFTAILSQAQLSTNQKTQVTSMIATATKPLIADIVILKAQLKLTQDSLTVLKKRIVPYNQMFMRSRLMKMRDSTSTFKIIEDIQ